MLIDIAITGDRNVIKKEAKKILKYKDLTIEIQPMWKVKTRVIPVIIGATGIISKSFRKYVSNIPLNHEVKELQKRAKAGTSDINTINSNDRIAETLYSLGRLFVSGIYV